ncbi:Olfactory receptor 11G2 [Vulpes lagopus]
MYILLADFSFLEIRFITSTVLQMLANFLSETSTICFYGCFLQFYFFSKGTAETFFLLAMAFDRFHCRPLHYPTVMTAQCYIRIGPSAGCVASPVFSPSLPHLPTSFLWPQYN